MSWIQKLYETYEQCKGHEPPGSAQLMPISHTPQQIHIEITIDVAGNFKGARIVQKEETFIPATEKSAGRTGSGALPHPLCDKVQYCANDYLIHGGKKRSFFNEYEEQLSTWCSSEFSHPKARAVLAYIRKHSVVSDLVKEKLLHLGADGKLLTQWVGNNDTPDIFRFLTAKEGERDQGDAFIRWHVREEGNPCAAVWEDLTLQDAWGAFDASTKELKGVCMVTGDNHTALAANHPKRIRHPGDGAKLISANDDTGYTFRGRFTDDTGQQACGVSYEVTQKAHNALRWLIQRQAYINGEQVIVTWSVAGKPVPDPFKDSLSLILGSEEISQASPEIGQPDVGDVGQAFAIRLRRAMAGYSAKLDPTEYIVVMSLDSALKGKGRMAITFYRELKGSDFLNRVQSWHEQNAWHQNFGKESKFVGAPAPRDIAEAAYGRRLDDNLRKATVERLLPCIIDGVQLPRDLVESVVRRTCNRVAFEKDKSGRQWEWEKYLGIACALFRGSYQERKYQMTLETERTSRDYLYGRLLSIAEHIEGRALYVGGEKRDTNAAKLMQRFADRPNSTWRTIELALTPSKSRLRAKRPAFMHGMETLLDEVVTKFEGDEFVSDRKLSGEFLLGYHCQRQALNPPKSDKPDESASDADTPDTDI